MGEPSFFSGRTADCGEIALRDYSRIAKSEEKRVSENSKFTHSQPSTLNLS